MKKTVFLLAAIFTVSALTGCGSDPEDVALGMVSGSKTVASYIDNVSIYYTEKGQQARGRQGGSQASPEQ